MVLLSSFVCLYRCSADRDLHSFPTRRSSDLDQRVLEELGAGLTRAFPALQAAPIIRGCAGLPTFTPRSEEHTSELQSHSDLVCRLLLEKKKARPTSPVGEG